MADTSTSIQSMIYEVRGQKVMLDCMRGVRSTPRQIPYQNKCPAGTLDRDLAGLYGVEVRRLNEATKRNIRRFPSDFMFRLTQDEWDNLRSQIATANTVAQDKGDNLRSQFVTAKSIAKVRFLPRVFTEHGVLMLSNVLNSAKAINMSIQIIRVFDKLRKYALGQKLNDVRIEELHKLLMLHIENNDYKFSEYDETIRQIVYALNNLIEHPPKTKKIGFHTGE